MNEKMAGGDDEEKKRSLSFYSTELSQMVSHGLVGNGSTRGSSHSINATTRRPPSSCGIQDQVGGAAGGAGGVGSVGGHELGSNEIGRSGGTRDHPHLMNSRLMGARHIF
ncbi:uncharacterized protein MELLADRAFT_73346 [Melampsora larici-populina 98AG31]|uniref:Uncharacterized protein n=1 Tax=Melampsora larici-populina (strain 98AG31 / pathotype 3-4-7) TaxID=747676 RepID=F4S6U8_MELLP|nr:uncharacterized protein MELLADRAFT_73346 [Melampsora larici-populina 98AG31]EGF99638.1 hypothetical protein MELLADRAFT_73346 [Melampsora larici-populina 98AG31]